MVIVCCAKVRFGFARTVPSEDQHANEIGKSLAARYLRRPRLAFLAFLVLSLTSDHA